MKGIIPATIIQGMETYAYTYASTTYVSPDGTNNWNILYPDSRMPMKDLF